MGRYLALFFLLGLFALPAAAFTLMEVEADPEKGFYFPYFLRVPDNPPTGATACLVVECNNTGRTDEDLEVHRESARDAMTGRSIGRLLGEELGMPFLMPVFPRPKSSNKTYTHALDRDTLMIAEGPLERLDLQLVAMVADARERLREMGWELDDRFGMAGFSASASFANRFSILHPRRLKWIVAGGLNGILALPLAELEGRKLPFPVGVGDLEELSGDTFDESAWRKIPQFLFMGGQDVNDAVLFDDAYSAEERNLIFALLGREMIPVRWPRCQEIYRQSGAACTFRTFEGLGHTLNPQAIAEIKAFPEL